MTMSDGIAIVGLLMTGVFGLAVMKEEARQVVWGMVFRIFVGALLAFNFYQVTIFTIRDGLPTRSEILSVIIASISIIALCLVCLIEYLIAQRKK